MVDVQQFDSPPDQPQEKGTLLRVASDTYTLLLVVGVFLLLISLTYLGFLALQRYGLGDAPVAGSVVNVSKQRTSVNLGSRRGSQAGKGDPSSPTGTSSRSEAIK